MRCADSHTLIIDRPEGRAGGMGLGFNGAQLLVLTIGRCFANDLRYVAAELGVTIGDISISFSVTLESSPIRAVGAEMLVSATMSGGSDPAPLIAKAKDTSMAMNSMVRGLPVSVSQSQG